MPFQMEGKCLPLGSILSLQLVWCLIEYLQYLLLLVLNFEK